MVQNASQIKNLLFAINSNLFMNFSGFQIIFETIPFFHHSNSLLSILLQKPF